MRRRLILLFFVPLVLSSTAARADEASEEEKALAEAVASSKLRPVTPRPWTELHTDVGVGLTSQGLHAGWIGLLRLGNFEFGPSAAASAFILGTRVGGGVALGWTPTVPSAFRLRLLVEAGALHEHVAQWRLFGQAPDPGVSGPVAYSGLRLGLCWPMAAPSRRPTGTIGLWLFADVDLSRTVLTSRFDEPTGRADGSVHEVSIAETIGGSYEYGVRVAVGLDFVP